MHPSAPLSPRRAKTQGNHISAWEFGICRLGKPADAVAPQKGEDAPMTKTFRKGMRVRWNWGQGVGRGRITERFDRHVERTIAGALVRRNGSPADPAYLDRKSGSEECRDRSRMPSSA
eukprot:TRINITY_DN76380_c0_g1_i1.p1 TRINITY_DN76380_c0_g1~~TRINITY_DN76380_c0_g1_i1.p1  ORF type:complete len:118 (+),score=5.41 TRINITY_DN76380_c0_g1_i1:27-380(+)